MSLDAGSVVLVVYGACLGSLALLGVHRLYLVTLYLGSRHRTASPPPGPKVWPHVTVQLPIFNEMYVVERLLDAVAALDYPRDRLEVQVLDDSTDGTRARIDARVARLRGDGLDIRVVRRAERVGFKAGALAHGLSSARGELICVFDADFCPPPEFLHRLVPWFGDPAIGMVQARWEHLNRGYSLLTRVQAVLLDAHFAVEQAARSRSDRFFNFNGTAGIWRRQAIEAAGGWQPDTLTEDLDLSYRAQLAGWRFHYLDSPAAPAELPVSLAAFKSQQRRWTRGAVQSARKLLPAIWRSPVRLAVKLEATFHMTANVAYPLMVALSLLAFPALALRSRLSGPDPRWFDLPVLLAATGSVCVFFLVAQRAVGRSPWRTLPLLPAVMALGAGIAISNALAVVGGLAGGPGAFVRTPKLALAPPGEVSRLRGYRSPQGLVPLLELAFALHALVATILAARLGMIESLPILLLFLVGYGWVAGASLLEARGGTRTRRDPAPA